MTEAQVDILMDNLMSVIDTLEDMDEIPTFNNSGFIKSHFIASCTNEVTKN